MISRLKKYNLTIAVIFAIIFLSMLSYVVFLIQVSNDLRSQINNHINEISGDARDYINAKIGEKINILETLGMCVTGDDNADRYLCDIFAEKNSFIDMEIIYDDEGKYDGSTIVSSDDSGDNSIEIYAGVERDNGKILIVGRSNRELLSELVDVSTFGQTNNTFICRRDGTLIVSSLKGADTLEDIFSQKIYAEKIRNNIQSRSSGYISYNEGKYKKYICYSRLSYDNLYMISIVSANIIESNYNNVYKKGIIFAVEISVAIAILLIYILYFNHRIKLYTQIVEERRAIYAKQFDGIVFEYKIKHKTMAIAGEADRLLSYEPEKGFIDIEKTPVITEDTKELLENGWSAKSEDGENIDEMDNVKLEFIDKNHDIRTVNGSLTAVRNKRGKVIKVVGCITDK